MLDVMGMSHQGGYQVDMWHEQEPAKALAMTECCRCAGGGGGGKRALTSCPVQLRDAAGRGRRPAAQLVDGLLHGREQRVPAGPDADVQRRPLCRWDVRVDDARVRVPSASAVSPPAKHALLPSLSSYYGEAGAWPHVSSSFGSYDLAGAVLWSALHRSTRAPCRAAPLSPGFAKSPVWWYRSWWLGNVSADDAGRPPLANTSTFVRIVESWRNSTNGSRVIHVYSNAPFARVSVSAPNGSVVFRAGPVPSPPFGSVTFAAVPFSPGTLTADGLDADDDAAAVLASDFARSWGAPAALVLSLDAPSLATGTGAAVLLDGGDVALVRATVIDAEGNPCGDATDNITFSVSDPGASELMRLGVQPRIHSPRSFPLHPSQSSASATATRATRAPTPAPGAAPTTASPAPSSRPPSLRSAPRSIVRLSRLSALTRGGLPALRTCG